MKTLKRLFLYCSIGIAYVTIKSDTFSSYGYWVSLILLILWYSLDIAEESIDD